MTNLEMSSGSRFGMESTPSSILMRFGKRELFICRDFYKRHYRSHPVIECNAGIQAGHLEILLFRKWLLVMSKAH